MTILGIGRSAGNPRGAPQRPYAAHPNERAEGEEMVQTATPSADGAGESRCGRLIPRFRVRAPGDPTSVRPPWEHVFVLSRGGRPPLTDGKDVLRPCPRHGVLPHRAFGRGANRRWRCRRCMAEAVSRRHREIRRILVTEAGGRCALCGYRRCSLSLQFHHVDPAAKSFNMTTGRGKGLETYRAEARKCVLLCANCHCEVEAGLRPSPPAGASYPA